MAFVEGGDTLLVDRVDLLTTIHHVDQQQLDWFAQTVDTGSLVSGYKMLDLCAGNGVASKIVVEYLMSEDIIPGEVIVADNHIEILQKATGNLAEYINARTMLVDLSKEFLDIEPGTLDIVVIKMGIHEFPLERQFQIIAQISELLKPGGQLIIWENNVVKGENGEDIYGFNQIIAEKDRLAGLEKMATDRYFTSEPELRAMSEQAGLTDFTVAHQWSREWKSHDRLHTEFKGNLVKLRLLNEEIDRNIPVKLREAAGYRVTVDDGVEGRAFIIPTQIISARKISA